MTFISEYENPSKSICKKERRFEYSDLFLNKKKNNIDKLKLNIIFSDKHELRIHISIVIWNVHRTRKTKNPRTLKHPDTRKTQTVQTIENKTKLETPCITKAHESAGNWNKGRGFKPSANQVPAPVPGYLGESHHGVAHELEGPLKSWVQIRRVCSSTISTTRINYVRF